MKRIRLLFITLTALVMSAFSFAQGPPDTFAAVTWNCRAHQFAPTLAYRGQPIQGLFDRWNVDTIVFAGATADNSFAGGAVGKFFTLVRNRANAFAGVAYVGDIQSSIQSMKFDVRLTFAVEFAVGTSPPVSAKLTYIGEVPIGKDKAVQLKVYRAVSGLRF